MINDDNEIGAAQPLQNINIFIGQLSVIEFINAWCIEHKKIKEK